MSSIDAYITLVTNSETGLTHGALYRNARTPSGCDRYLLSITTTEGYRSETAAANAMNVAFPDLSPISLTDLEGDIGALISHLPRSAALSRIVAKDGSLDLVEVRASGNANAPLIDVSISPRQLVKLELARLIEFDSSSGDDPELSCRYDNYKLRAPRSESP